jgi:tetratricopeptide (TPR) repeat protein
MSKDPPAPEAKANLMSWFKSASEWLKILGSLLAASIAVCNFLFNCDRRGLAWTLGILGYSGLLALFLYTALSKRQVLRLTVSQRRKIAVAGMWLLIALNVVGVEVRVKRNRDVCSKVVVLVTKFGEPEPGAYQCYDIMLRQLRSSLEGSRDTVLLIVNDMVTETEGPEKAQLLGECNCAKLVLWGNCAYNPHSVKVTVHVEDTTKSKTVPLFSKKPYSKKGTVADLSSFQFQETFSEELSGFVQFLTGLIRYEAKDYHGAITHFRSADVKNWAEDQIAKAHLFLYRGNAHFFNGDLDEAISDYSGAIKGYSEASKDNKQLATAYYNRGVAQMSFGAYEPARADYLKAIEFDGDLAEAYNNLGFILNAQGKYKEALDNYSRAINIDNKYAEAFNNRAVALTTLNQNREDIEEAIKDCSRAIELNPRYPEAYYNRGNAYSALAEFEKTSGNDRKKQEDYRWSIKDYTQAIELNKDYAEAYNNRGDTFSLLGEYYEAIKDCSTALEINPRYPEAYITRGVARAALGQHSEAIGDCSKALEINPLYPEAYLTRGVAWAALGKTDDAIKDFRKTKELSNDPRILDEAEKQLRIVEARAPNTHAGFVVH